MDNAKRVISGTWGEVWLDGEHVGECYGLQAKMSFTKEDVQMCGQMFVDTKTTSAKGTGSLKMHKVNSRMVDVIGEYITNGRDTRFTIVSKLADPDSYGVERVAIPNVSFDDLTIADWEAAKKGAVECPFTFAASPKWLDTIGVVA
jgi:hypothetical protein